jgi:membrane-associated protease RseP (regulator of RpoE activity)
VNEELPPTDFQIQERAIFTKKLRSRIFHTILFLLTFFTTTLAGVQWLNRDPLELANFAFGLPYSLSLLAVLAAHEFGHYFAAKYYSIETTYPYFIPIPPFLLNPFGTMGAVIRIRSPITTKKALFDIGIAGPLAGLVVTVGFLLYGFLTLPGKEYLYSIHPEYRSLSAIPEIGLTFGNSLLFWGISKLFSASSFVPPMNEVYHYPFLCVGWFGLFITALNLIPVGQLDGGHILYSLVGRRQGLIARVFFALLILIGLSSFVPYLGWHVQPGTLGWLLWAGILFFLIKLDHPEVLDDTVLDSRRQTLGWLTFCIFILTFPPIPFFELIPK